MIKMDKPTHHKRLKENSYTLKQSSFPNAYSNWGYQGKVLKQAAINICLFICGGINICKMDKLYE